MSPGAQAAADAWTTRYLLPFALVLLMLSVDLRSIAKLGGTALVTLLAGTLGIVVGGPIAYLAFGNLLPPEAWKGLAALSGSWIGGTANMVAIAESVGTPADILGPNIVVDAVVGYGWMGVLLLLSGWQARFNRRMGARTAAFEETNRRLAEEAGRRTPIETRHAAVLIGLGFGCAVASVVAGARLPALGDPTIISGTTWAVLIVVTTGLVLSFTPVRRLEEAGASRFGYAALYLLLAGIGAQADLRAVLAVPAFLAAGALCIGLLMAVAGYRRAGVRRDPGLASHDGLISGTAERSRPRAAHARDP